MYNLLIARNDFGDGGWGINNKEHKDYLQSQNLDLYKVGMLALLLFTKKTSQRF